MSHDRFTRTEFFSVTPRIAAELLDAAHQSDRAVLLPVVKEERQVRKPTDKVIAPVLPGYPVLSLADIMSKIPLLYQCRCINKL